MGKGRGAADTMEGFAGDGPRSNHMGQDVPVLYGTNPKMPWWTMGDVDSFFMLLFDNLSSLSGIIAAALNAPVFNATPCCQGAIIHEFENMIFKKMLPGAGLALMGGNCYYSWMARKLAKYDDRTNVTAHPYGVNTPGGFLMVFSLVYPLTIKYLAAPDQGGEMDCVDGQCSKNVKEQVEKVWQGAVASNMVVGLISCAGAFAGPWIVRNVPLPALLTPTMGVGLMFLAMDPWLLIASEPVTAYPSLWISMAGYFATRHGSFEVKGIKIPCAALAILVGVILYWSNTCHYNRKTFYSKGINPPVTVSQNYARGCGSNTQHRHDVAQAKKRLWENQMTVGLGLARWTDVPDFLGLVTPVAIQSVVETLEHWQMGCLKGDSYNMQEMLFADGFWTVIGSIFGSFLPNTVYLGHPIHKGNGASCGYGLANALLFLFLLNAGFFAMINAVIPLVIMNVIILAVGLSIVRNALWVTNARSYPAMMLGLMCVLANWTLSGGYNENAAFVEKTRGLWNLAAGGGIMNALIITAIFSDLIDHRYWRAAAFCFVAIWLSMFGVMHSNNLQGHSIGADGRATRGEVTWAERAPGNEGWRFAIAYSVVCAGLIASHFLQKAGLTDPVIEDKHAAALEKTISKASDASNSGKDFSFGSDEVPPEVKDMSTGHAISA